MFFMLLQKLPWFPLYLDALISTTPFFVYCTSITFPFFFFPKCDGLILCGKLAGPQGPDSWSDITLDVSMKVIFR